jgi:hypothetical protein
LETNATISECWRSRECYSSRWRNLHWLWDDNYTQSPGLWIPLKWSDRKV